VKVASAGMTPHHTHGIRRSGDDSDDDGEAGDGSGSDGIALVGASSGKGRGLAN